MGLIVPSRRGFLAGVSAFLAAPSIVRASNLMPIKVAREDQRQFSMFRVTNYGTDTVYVGGMAVPAYMSALIMAPVDFMFGPATVVVEKIDSHLLTF